MAHVVSTNAHPEFDTSDVYQDPPTDSADLLTNAERLCNTVSVGSLVYTMVSQPVDCSLAGDQMPRYLVRAPRGGKTTMAGLIFIEEPKS